MEESLYLIISHEADFESCTHSVIGACKALDLAVAKLREHIAETFEDNKEWWEDEEDEDAINAVKKHLATINTYIKTAKKNFAIGKVDEDAYSSTLADLEAEKRATEAELEKISVNLSNLASYIEDAIRIACNLSSY